MRNLRNKNAPANRGILETKIRNVTLALMDHMKDLENPHEVESGDGDHTKLHTLVDPAHHTFPASSNGYFLKDDGTWAPGDTGPQGEQGIQGDPGADGLKGDTGDQGIQGNIGLTGDPGIDGLDGADGQQGIQGDTGLTGDDGSQGIQGVPGNDGNDGAKGDTGDTGIQGIQGIQGNTGADGIQGDQGTQGDTGPEGPTAVSTDADNHSTLGSDSLLFTPTKALDSDKLGGQLPAYYSEAHSHPYASDVNEANWNLAFGWGDHGLVGYLTTFSETNDLSAAVTWTDIPIANVPTGTTGTTVALGNHNHTGVYEPVDATIVRDDDAGYNNTNWDTAYGWGNHASAGYAVSAHVHSSLAASDGSPDPALSVDADGNVGIGTIGTHKLEVLANSEATAIFAKRFSTQGVALYATSTGNYVAGTGDGKGLIYDAKSATSRHSWLIDGNEKMRIDSDGKVGIGTNSPNTKLNVEGAKNTSILQLGSLNNDSSWGIGDALGKVEFYSADGSGGGVGVKSSISVEVEGGTLGNDLAMIFRHAGSSAGQNNLERMRIDSNGNVGIGTNSPDGKFEVRVGTTGRIAKFSAEYHNAALYITSPSVEIVDINTGFDTDSGGDRNLTLSTKDQVRVWIDGGTGNVGIVTTSPDTPLNVGNHNGGSPSAQSGVVARFERWGDLAIELMGNTANNTSIFFGNHNDTNMGRIVYANAEDRMSFYAAKTLIMSLMDGNVGIGTSSPDATLEVVTSNARAIRVMRTGGNPDIRLQRDGVDKIRLLTQATGGIVDSMDGALRLRTSIAADVIIETNSSERMRIDSDGNVGIKTGDLIIGTAGKGIDFDPAGSGAQANLLDDYEEGTWTGTLRGSGADPTTPVTATGYYTKIGNRVDLDISFDDKDTSGASGAITITGAPFTSANNSTISIGSCLLHTIATITGAVDVSPSIIPNSSIVQFLSNNSSGSWSVVNHTALSPGFLRASISYTV